MPALAAIWPVLKGASSYWREILIGLLVVAIGIQTLRLSWAENELISDKLAQEKAVREAQERADRLSDELVIEQAKNMARTEKVVIEYRDRIRAAPDDRERNRLGTLGVRDTLGLGNAEAK